MNPGSFIPEWPLEGEGPWPEPEESGPAREQESKSRSAPPVGHLDFNLVRAYGLWLLAWINEDSELIRFTVAVPSLAGLAAFSGGEEKTMTWVTMNLSQLLQILQGQEPTRFRLEAALPIDN